MMLLLLLSLLFSQTVTAQTEILSEPQPFSVQWLEAQARALSDQPYAPNPMAEDNPLRSLSYDDYRRIVFDPDAAIWADEGIPFQLQLFHPGFLHTTPVGIHLVDEGNASRLTFSSDLFNYQDSPVNVRRMNAGGYAGFRVHYPINTPERHEEFLVFLGASYFRAVAKDQFYGLSARGLAINTAGPDSEEFPRFSDFWVQYPEDGSDRIIIHALLDSASVTGTYHFSVSPGDSTIIDVDARLFPREDLAHVGIAPLTSMFMFNATNRADFNDYRNAVHDSDGLKILQADGEQIWRPLTNPTRFQASVFGATPETPAGFGLLQRRQGFERFNDDEARYDKRPSLWIEPLGDWGDGRVELVEIPTGVEYLDNIVAYWQPEGGLKAGAAYQYAYRMHWGTESPAAKAQGRVIDTAAGNAINSDDLLFVIDYNDGRAVPDLDINPESLRITATTSDGEITDARGTLLEATGHYRAYVRFDPGQAELAELRVTRTTANGEQWGETWLYRWTR